MSDGGGEAQTPEVGTWNVDLPERAGRIFTVSIAEAGRWGELEEMSGLCQEQATRGHQCIRRPRWTMGKTRRDVRSAGGAKRGGGGRGGEMEERGRPRGWPGQEAG